MYDEQTQHKYKRIKLVLLIIGVFSLLLGAVFSILGLIKFAGSIGSHNMDSYFIWEFIIGAPATFVGIVCILFSAFGSVNKYIAHQTAPVAKDVTNYMIDGTSDSVIRVVEKIKGDKVGQRACFKCGAVNDINQKFCGHCGADLSAQDKNQAE